jgi:CRISPR/Cas system endoribonuclease Cas6 (RAMP superfamily)
VLQGISEQFGDFNEIMCLALGPGGTDSSTLPPTPVRLQNATKRARRVETWMEMPQTLKFLDVLKKNKAAMDIYATFNDDEDTEFRIMWVKSKIGL